MRTFSSPTHQPTNHALDFIAELLEPTVEPSFDESADYVECWLTDLQFAHARSAQS